MAEYSLSSILSALFKHKKSGDQTLSIVKRLIFNRGALGGLSSKSLILFFISMPFIEYALIFNPYVFGYLGIAQSIVFYIIFLVFIMQIVFVMIWMNNKKVLKMINGSWEEYFPGIDLKLVLSSGVSPYNDFYKAYVEAENSSKGDEQLHQALTKAFKAMQEENRDLLEAIQKDRAS